MWHDFAKALREIRRNLAEGGGTYRPDLHYMRGPGPKWHAKYGNLLPQVQPGSTPVAPRLRELAEHRA